MSFDIENSIATGELLCIAVEFKRIGSERSRRYTLTGPEPIILSRMEALVHSHDPDVIMGYNSDGYDIPPP